MFEKMKQDRKVKQDVIETIDREIEDIRLGGTGSAEEIMKLYDLRRKAMYNGADSGGITQGDVLKVVANIAVVAVLVGFEMSNVMNQKGSRFIKTL